MIFVTDDTLTTEPGPLSVDADICEDTLVADAVDAPLIKAEASPEETEPAPEPAPVLEPEPRTITVLKPDPGPMLEPKPGPELVVSCGKVLMILDPEAIPESVSTDPSELVVVQVVVYSV